MNPTSPSTISATSPVPPVVPDFIGSSPDGEVLSTIFSWPTMEPLRFEPYSASQLHLPLRRDILHRAVIFEGDKTRQGTASTKWRKDVHGSSRKLAPQKGTGRARVGDKKSPIRKGGGVAFGPHPRDFSTKLQRKVYDLAWRTALSYRYRRGQLFIIANDITIPPNAGPRLLKNIFIGNKWSRGHGRSTLVTTQYREQLFNSMAEIDKHGIVKDMYDIDVKDLLATGRIIIEKQALDTILLAHNSDLGLRHNMEHAAAVIAQAQLEDAFEAEAGIAEESEGLQSLREEDITSVEKESPDVSDEENIAQGTLGAANAGTVR